MHAITFPDERISCQLDRRQNGLKIEIEIGYLFKGGEGGFRGGDGDYCGEGVRSCVYISGPKAFFVGGKGAFYA